jgi:hypothetical protein
MVERVNRTLADIIASYVSEEPSKWSDFLPSATFRYNTAVNSSTGYSPFYLMYGREATEPQGMIKPVRNRDMTDLNMIFSQMWYDAVEKTKEKLEEAKEIQKKYYNRNAKRVEFEVGDNVLLKEMANIPGKFNMRWEGPFSIAERKGNVNYKIISQNGKKLLIVHSDRLKKFNRVEKNDNQTLEISVDKVNEEPSLIKETRKGNKKTNSHATTLRNNIMLTF